MKEYNQYSHLSDTRSSGYTDNFGVFFRTFVRNQRTSWARYVKIIQNIINITRHESTGFTPMELHFNIKPMRVWEKWLPLIDSNKMTHKQKIFFARERAYSFLKKQASRKNDQTRHFEFKIGDRVLVKSLNVANAAERNIAKFFHVYEGPYTITQKIGPDTYVLLDVEANRERGKFHIQNLKLYF